jgi:hypothetical protein
VCQPCIGAFTADAFYQGRKLHVRCLRALGPQLHI